MAFIWCIFIRFFTKNGLSMSQNNLCELALTYSYFKIFHFHFLWADSAEAAMNTSLSVPGMFPYTNSCTKNTKKRNRCWDGEYVNVRLGSFKGTFFTTQQFSCVIWSVLHAHSHSLILSLLLLPHRAKDASFVRFVQTSAVFVVFPRHCYAVNRTYRAEQILHIQ